MTTDNAKHTFLFSESFLPIFCLLVLKHAEHTTTHADKHIHSKHHATFN